MFKWMYSIEVRRVTGGWSHGTIWSCHPSHFRSLLRYINGESDPCTGWIVANTSRPDTRIRRAQDDAAPDFHWPEDQN